MRTTVTVFLVFAMFILCSGRYYTELGIKISITNIRNDKGTLLVTLFKDGAGYPDDPGKALKRVKLAIANKKAEVLFSNLPAGTYAVAILHDENNDLKMNKNLLGIPKEGFGFSNNVTGTFGPPSFSRAGFTYSPGQLTQVPIRVKYY